MKDSLIYQVPEVLHAITRETELLGFDMASEPQTGAFLRVLAASKPGGAFLEIGTGTGISTAWILDGMDKDAALISIDNDPVAMDIARQNLGKDLRVTFLCEEGTKWLKNHQKNRFDFIFADAFPGKFDGLELAINILKKGGLYIIDDLLPQKNWPNGHGSKVPELVHEIESKQNIKSVRISWASGLMVATKTD